MRLRMLRFFVLLMLVVSSMSVLTANMAFAASISSPQFQAGREITITGSGFGPDANSGDLCFNDTRHCLSQFISWSDTKIVFEAPPDDIPIAGTLTLYVLTNGRSEALSSFSYTYQPLIARIDNVASPLPIDKTIATIAPEKTIDVQGYSFGTSGTLALVDTTTNSTLTLTTLSWSDGSIRVTIPKVARVYNQIKVTNLNGLSHSVDLQVNPTVSNDPLAFLQRYLALTNIPDLWENIKPTTDVVVAVIDDGVYYNHPDLKGRMWQNSKELLGNNLDDDKNGFTDDVYGWNFITNSRDIDVLGLHGTAVAGIIAAVKNNNEGMAGIAERAKIMPLIVCDSDGVCVDDAVIKAMNYAIDNGARVINLSLGDKKITGFSNSYNAVIKKAYEKGVVIVLAAGNGDVFGKPLDTTNFKLSPLCNETTREMIIGVGATASNNEARTSFSNFGKCVDVYAPGEGILSANIPVSNGETYYSNQNAGTSFSAPIVSGIAAHILSAHPNMSNKKVWDYVVRTANRRQIVDARAIADGVKTYDAAADDGFRWNNDDFRDVISSAYRTAINSLKRRGVVAGYPDGGFHPTALINRAEFMKIVMNASSKTAVGSGCFSDVKDEWFAPYICGAKSLNIVSGYPDGTFRPNQNINVVEGLKIVFNAFQAETRAVAEGEAWFAPFVEYAQAHNVFLSSFQKVDKTLTREEMAELVYRLLK